MISNTVTFSRYSVVSIVGEVSAGSSRLLEEIWRTTQLVWSSPLADAPLPDGASDRMMPTPRVVDVPWERLAGWIERYESRHGETTWAVSPDLVTAQSSDGTRLAFAVPLGPVSGSSVESVVAHLELPWRLGVVLVRRGGFAVARVVGPKVVESKVGQRHVQGRSKAGGWSQQRFARRRENQAQAAYDATAAHVRRILGSHAGSLDVLATGGDRTAVRTVLARPDLSALSTVQQQWLGGAFGDPRRDVLTAAIAAARSVQIEIWDPPESEKGTA